MARTQTTWQQHVQATRAQYGCSFKDALSLASQTYRGCASTSTPHYRRSKGGGTKYYGEILSCRQKAQLLMETGATKAEAKKQLRECMTLVGELNNDKSVQLQRKEEDAMKDLLYEMGILLLGSDAQRKPQESDAKYIKRLEKQFQMVSKELKIGLAAAGISALVAGVALYKYPELKDRLKGMFDDAKTWFRNMWYGKPESRQIVRFRRES